MGEKGNKKSVIPENCPCAGPIVSNSLVCDDMHTFSNVLSNWGGLRRYCV